MVQAPLAGVRVLDASRILAGPYCCQLLADLGAEVIKVERPGAGDDTRTWGPPFVGEFSSYFLACNRNKRSVTLDVGQSEGLELFYRLAGRSDVVVENFRAASAQKLGLDPETLHARHPRLIVCSISGFGRTGPLADQPGYDFAIQGLSGLMSITGPADGPPAKVGVAVTDVLAGLHAAVAILACLHARAQTQQGYAVDLALLDVAVAAQVNVAQAYLSTGEVPARQGNAHLQIVPYEAFETADEWLILAIGNDAQWRRFCTSAGQPEWADHPHFATNPARVEHRELLVPQLARLLKTRTSAEWRALCEQQAIPCAPVQDYRQLFAMPQAQARRLRTTVRDRDGREVDLLGSPFRIAGAALPTPDMPPRLGQHTAEVLGDLLGLGADAIAALQARKIL